MTADDAGVSVRERLAAILYGTWLPEKLWPHLTQQSREKYFEAADAILAAGFGDVAEVKAAALDEAREALEADRREGSTFLRVVPIDSADRVSRHAENWLRARASEYRSTDTSWADPDRDERRRPGCHCFMWDEDCPEHAKNK